MNDQNDCPRARARQTATALNDQIWALSAAVMRVSTINGLAAADRDMWKHIFFDINDSHRKVISAVFCLEKSYVKCVSDRFDISDCYRLLDCAGMISAQYFASQASDLDYASHRMVFSARIDVTTSVARLIADLHRIQSLSEPQPALAA
ncbi:hypothetical protein [Methylobacterium sp. Leaf117]|uniref:hypothetical protein n=1 Tax=Methylobacterium sp. Leaf117 TaxID=1736260 RepID=UPI0006F3333D|nr:hypothetical protein [Methylobacterium sp. Leaf117]KQP92962.1 hypothetical protein ASF57_22660 [Methylobacterium sp. Leaf117]